MSFDPTRLRRGEWIAGVGGVLLLVVMFLTWYEPAAYFSGPRGLYGRVLDSWTAWQAFSVIDLLLALTAVAAVALAVATATLRTDAIPLALAVVVNVLALLSTLLVAFRLFVDQPGFGLGYPDASVQNAAWAYVGLAACLVLMLGSYLSLRDEDRSAPLPDIPVRRLS